MPDTYGLFHLHPLLDIPPSHSHRQSLHLLQCGREQALHDARRKRIQITTEMVVASFIFGRKRSVNYFQILIEII